MSASVISAVNSPPSRAAIVLNECANSPSSRFRSTSMRAEKSLSATRRVDIARRRQRSQNCPTPARGSRSPQRGTRRAVIANRIDSSAAMGASTSDSSSVATTDQLRSPYSGSSISVRWLASQVTPSMLERRGAFVGAKRELVELARNRLLRTGKEAARAIADADHDPCRRVRRPSPQIRRIDLRNDAPGSRPLPATRVLANSLGCCRASPTLENGAAMRQPIRLHHVEQRRRRINLAEDRA